jgi:RNA polymerase sigma-70 factor (ECF subfamily)
LETQLDNTELTALVQRSADGDQSAFEQLYRETSPYLNALVLRIVRTSSLAEEVLQEAFIQVWQNASKFDPLRGSSLAWLTNIVRSRALDRVRHEKSQRTRVDKVSLEPMLASLEESDQSSRFSREFKKLQDCLKPISAEQRRCIILAYCYGLSHSELAESLKAPIGTVKSWVRRALNSVRDCMKS